MLPAIEHGKSVARLLALPDVLQVFRSRLLLPTSKDRQVFLDHYAPGNARFQRLVLWIHRRKVPASVFRRLLKLGVFWKGL